MKSKNVYVIAGPNGSGKTTFARTFLPAYAHCRHFINADLIAEGLSPFSPQLVAIKSGKIVLEQIEACSEKGVDFGFETTMAGAAHLKRFKALREKGYKIHVFFLWIPGTQLAIVRVRGRVAQGGHHVPSEDIKRRFGRSIERFLRDYRPLSDQWILFNNAEATPVVIAMKQNSRIQVQDQPLFEKIVQGSSLQWQRNE